MKAFTLLCLTVLCAAATAQNNDSQTVERHLKKLESWIEYIPGDVLIHITVVQGQLLLFCNVGREAIFKRLDSALMRTTNRTLTECTAARQALRDFRSEISSTLVKIKDVYMEEIQMALQNYHGVIHGLQRDIAQIRSASCNDYCPHLVDASFDLLVNDGTNLMNVMAFKDLANDVIFRMATNFYDINYELEQKLRDMAIKCQI